MTTKAKLLFVDDEPQILVTLRALFRAKYEVYTATSGAEALEIIQREHIHAIISDQRMPHMFGHQLLQQVKTISPNTMRILLTGYSDMSAIVNSINEGEVFRFVNKPWQTAELRNIVDTAVGIAQGTLQSMADSGEELSSTEMDPVGLLVLDDDPGTLQSLNKLFKSERSIYTARSIDQAIEILGSKEVGVIITETELKGESTTDFIKLLKQQFPLVMTIVQTTAMDADMAIKLINQGQVYRYLNKPVGNSLLYLSIKHGLRFYQINKAKPELLQRQHVEINEELQNRNQSLMTKLAGRLRSIRWFRFSFA